MRDLRDRIERFVSAPTADRVTMTDSPPAYNSGEANT
jgi:hypothetical protein